MKRVILPMGAIAAFALSASCFAAADNNTSTSSEALTAQVNALSAQTKKLQHEVIMLKKQSKKKHKAVAKGKKVVEPKASAKEPWNHFVTVTTTPFMGQHTAYDGGDLLTNLSSMNEDLTLLEAKQKLINAMAAQGYTLDRPVLQLSGTVEGEMYGASGFGTQTTQGMSLATAELDMNAIASSWATAFMSMDFNGAPISTGNREPNSTIYLGRGFVTIGNLNVNPIYFSAGLMYAPFGRYASNMVSTPITQSMGKIRTPMALLGFKLNNGLYGALYGYAGSQTSGGSPLIKQEGANLGFKQTFGITGKNSYSLGTGWVSNIADSEGQQNTGLSTANGQFGGFAVFQPNSTVSNNNLVHTVDAGDVHGHVTVGRVTLIGEYLGAARRYATADMTYNNKGALPQAAHAEIDYLVPFLPKKYGTNTGFAYDHAWQALALNLPENSYSVFFNTSIWRETIESLEYRHDSDYSTGDSAFGRGATAAIVGTGRTRNSVIGEVGVYF